MEDKKIAYAERAIVNLLELDIMFQGQMQSAMAAQNSEPRLMLMKRGNIAVKSVPQDRELAEMLVPSCASVNTNEIRNTPPLVPLVKVV